MAQAGVRAGSSACAQMTERPLAGAPAHTPSRFIRPLSHAARLEAVAYARASMGSSTAETISGAYAMSPRENSYAFKKLT